MELHLNRNYYPNGTNGQLYHGTDLLCFTIELPWLFNQSRISCIPEGRYLLQKRYSVKYKWHLLLPEVPGRSLILIHPANDARKELKGCIAPVMRLTGAGTGWRSRIAFERVKRLVFEAMERKEPVFLIIQSNKHETSI